MIDFTRRERQHLREIAGEVYEAEMAVHLGELAAQFTRWRAGEVLPSELVDFVHQFHQGPARRIWSMYQAMDERNIVARGIALGLLPAAKVGGELHERLQPLIEAYRQ